MIVLQDLDAPNPVGSFWGEVQSNVHKALGCVGTVTDGGVRDLDEMRALNFRAFASQPLVSHAYVHLVDASVPVTVGGLTVNTGDLILGDQHGVTNIPMDIAAEVPAEVRRLEARRAGDDRRLPGAGLHGRQAQGDDPPTVLCGRGAAEGYCRHPQGDKRQPEPDAAQERPASRQAEGSRGGAAGPESTSAEDGHRRGGTAGRPGRLHPRARRAGTDAGADRQAARSLLPDGLRRDQANGGQVGRRGAGRSQGAGRRSGTIPPKSSSSRAG